MSEAAARAAAFRIGEKLNLPLTARTLTVAEFRRNERRFAALVCGVFVVPMAWILISLAVDGGRESLRILAFMVPFTLLSGAILGLLVRRRLKKRAGCRDHGVAIEVGERGIRIEWDRQSHALDYADVRYALYWRVLKGSTEFLGIRLETPIGPLHLLDQWYRGGCAAAAAIVTGHDKWHHLRRLA